MVIYRLKEDLFFAQRGTLFIQHPNKINRFYPEQDYAKDGTGAGTPVYDDLHGFTREEVEGAFCMELVYQSVEPIEEETGDS